MTEQKRYPLFRKTQGLNTRVDPTRVFYDPENGITDLIEAVNIDIDDAGGIDRRLGQDRLSAVPSHSVFCAGGDALVVQDRASDAALYQIATDFSLTGLRSGLVKGTRLSYAQVGDRIWYTSLSANGYVEAGASHIWPSTVYRGPETLRELYPAPLGKHLAYFQGRWWIAVGDVIYASEPFKPGLYRMAGCFYQLGSDIRMMRPVANGVWVSDSISTGFIAAAEKWDQYKYKKESSYPAHEWSDNQRLVDLSKTSLEIPGLSAVWSSDAGLCVGSADGKLTVVTEEKLLYPIGASGATVVDGHIAINSVY